MKILPIQLNSTLLRGAGIITGKSLFRCFDTIDTLEAVLAERCVTLLALASEVRALTSPPGSLESGCSISEVGYSD